MPKLSADAQMDSIRDSVSWVLNSLSMTRIALQRVQERHILWVEKNIPDTAREGAAQRSTSNHLPDVCRKAEKSARNGEASQTYDHHGSTPPSVADIGPEEEEGDAFH